MTDLPPTSLDAVRTAIDDLDDRIVALLAERERLVRRAGRLKGDVTKVAAPARVEQVIGRVRARAARHGADQELVERIYRGMIAAFVDLERGEAQSE